jgi:hypothetical protein
MLIIPGGRRSRLADSVSLTGMLIKLSYFALPRFHEIIAVLKLRVASFTDTYDSGRLATHNSELSFRHIDSYPVRPSV